MFVIYDNLVEEYYEKLSYAMCKPFIEYTTDKTKARNFKFKAAAEAHLEGLLIKCKKLITNYEGRFEIKEV